jgi:hypothetical protein
MTLRSKLRAARGKGQGIKVFGSVFSEQKLPIASVLDWRVNAFAGDLDDLFNKYQNTRDLTILSSLEKSVQGAATYAHKYQLQGMPSFAILGGLWLAVLQEGSTRQERRYRPKLASAVKELLSGVESYEAEVKTGIAARYVPIRAKNGYNQWF